MSDQDVPSPEEASKTIQYIFDAFGRAIHPAPDRMIDGLCLIDGIEPVVRFKKAQGCVRVSVDHHRMGLELSTADAKALSGTSSKTVHWDGLMALRAAFDGRAPTLVDQKDRREDVYASATGPEHMIRIIEILDAAEAWLDDEDTVRGWRADFTAPLGRAGSALDIHIHSDLPRDADVLVDQEALKVLTPPLQAMEIRIPGQNASAITSRLKRGDPICGYARVTQARFERSMKREEQAVDKLRRMSQVAPLMAARGLDVRALARIVSRHAETIDMEGAHAPKTVSWRWPHMIPRSVEHLMADLGVDGIWAYHLSNHLTQAEQRAGHRTPSFERKAAGRYFRWDDADTAGEGSKVSLPQGTVEFLCGQGLMVEKGDAMIPTERFHEMIVAGVLSRAGNDGEIIAGITMEMDSETPPTSYGMIDLRSTPRFIDRVEGADGYPKQKREAKVTGRDAVLPSIRVGNAVWIDYISMDSRRRSEPEKGIPKAWRAIAFPEHDLAIRTGHAVTGISALHRLDEDFDVETCVDRTSPLTSDTGV